MKFVEFYFEKDLKRVFYKFYRFCRFSFHRIQLEKTRLWKVDTKLYSHSYVFHFSVDYNFKLKFTCTLLGGNVLRASGLLTTSVLRGLLF